MTDVTIRPAVETDAAGVYGDAYATPWPDRCV